MHLIDESEALRDQIYFWRFFDFRALISSLYLIFYSFLKSTIFLLFISRKHSYFKTHSCAQRLITSFSRDSFRYFKCCIQIVFFDLSSVVSQTQAAIWILYFLTYEGQPWEKVFCDTMLNKKSKCDIRFYQHAYQRVFDFRFSGDALNLCVEPL